MRRALKWFGGLLLLLLVLAVVAVIVGPPKVPAEAIANSVDRTPALMDRAYSLPVGTAYGRQLYFQSNGSVCGPASLVNVRRSLGLETPNEAAVLNGTGLCWTGMCFMGLTLDELAEVARARSDLKVKVLRDLTSDQFKEHLLRSNDPSRRYVINFNRKAIFGAGGGHHSPIGGYLEAEDKVLVLDVNADFEQWIVERARLFAAMNTIDGSSGAKRGLLLIEPTKG